MLWWPAKPNGPRDGQLYRMPGPFQRNPTVLVLGTRCIPIIEKMDDLFAKLVCECIVIQDSNLIHILVGNELLEVVRPTDILWSAPGRVVWKAMTGRGRGGWYRDNLVTMELSALNKCRSKYTRVPIHAAELVAVHGGNSVIAHPTRLALLPETPFNQHYRSDQGIAYVTLYDTRCVMQLDVS